MYFITFNWFLAAFAIWFCVAFICLFYGCQINALIMIKNNELMQRQ